MQDARREQGRTDNGPTPREPSPPRTRPPARARKDGATSPPEGSGSGTRRAEPGLSALLAAAQMGDAAATETLLGRYRYIAVRLARRHVLPGAEAADLFQIACVGLLWAIRHYDEARGHFEAFAWCCAAGEVRQAIRREARPGRRLLNEAASLHELVATETGDPAPPLPHPTAEDSSGLPAALLRARAALDPLEWRVAVALCGGCSQRQTARRLGVSDTTVHRIWRRVRDRLRSMPELFD